MKSAAAFNKTGNPLGVFDSGVGGLTVVRALLERLPFEKIIYFGDTARVPYGVKSAETIIGYARQITGFLLARDVKLLIVACNTMSAVAYEAISELSAVPVLDVIQAGAGMACAATKTKRVGVIGTPATIGSDAYTRAIHRRDHEISVFSKACPLFVPLVEEGWLDHPATILIAREYLASVLARQIDTLVLGCTHYPLLKPLLQETAGPEIMLVDSAIAVAEVAARLLKEKGLEAPPRENPEHRFFVTDAPYRFQQTGESFLKRPLAPLEIVRW
ncbi:MAG: glutamate racemase [Syntrophobacterales bacterium]|nr:glutamate racemase [Syntrophobacterales bacterium]